MKTYYRQSTLFILTLFWITSSNAQTVEYTASASVNPSLKGSNGPFVASLGEAYHITGNPTTGDEQKGQAYLTWQDEHRRRIQTLSGEHSRPYSYFGFSAATDGIYAIVGAPGDGAHRTGKSYLYQKNGDEWKSAGELEAMDGTPRDEFGYAVSLHPDYAFVGTPSHDTYIRNGGAVYVYRRTPGATWEEEGQLIPRKAKKATGFGSSLQILDDYLIVGAYQPGGFTESQWFVFELQEERWVEIEKYGKMENLVDFLEERLPAMYTLGVAPGQYVAADE